MRSRISCLLPIIAFIAVWDHGVAAQADEVSIVGDGSLYYCDGREIEDYDGIVWLQGTLRKASTGRRVRFDRALAIVNSNIERLRRRLRYASTLDVNGLRLKLSAQRLLRSDIRRCENNGTTGRSESPPPHVPGPASACSVVGGTQNVTAYGSVPDAAAIVGAEATVAAPIIDGTRCSIGDSPVVYVSLYSYRGGNEGACSGTVVRRRGENFARAIIFAAHCTDGVDQVAINGPGGVLFSTQIFAHPSWDPAQEITEENDVALALFAEDIPTRSVEIISDSLLSVGESAVIAGYGVDQHGVSGPDRLKAGFVTLSKIAPYGIQINFRGNGDANTCFGDSGGPLLVARGGTWVVAGATSNGEDDRCAAGDHSNFSNLTSAAVRGWANAIAPGLMP